MYEWIVVGVVDAASVDDVEMMDVGDVLVM